jgi:asparagine synthase (glutamine-hydrolysing)
MLPSLARRGPDHEGRLVLGRAALGHRRLSIIDLSDAGHQPMADEELGLAIVHNGEIYNYKELREELAARGYRFRSHSDTEVILKAYDAWGEDGLRRLQGMFAFCLQDERRDCTLLVRDRLGIKPLYYVDRGDRVYFASNIQALRAAGVVDGSVDAEALHHYLTFHSVVPAPLTIYRGVRKMEPGTVLRLEADGGRSQHRYWEVSFEPDPGRSEADWEEAILEALRRAVRRRLVADVPVGALLSGGLDSSLIVALMAAEAPETLQTFSIGFEDVGEEEGNEFRWSDRIARDFRTRHHRIFIDGKRLLPALQGCVAAMAEPMVSHDAVGFYLLSQEVSRFTRVVLSGQGADEIFGGYHWYPRIRDDAGDPAERYRRHFCDRSHAELLQTIEPAFHTEDVSDRFIRTSFDRPGAPEAVDKALRLDTTVMLIEDPVKRVDNMTMAWGLEGRVPFLDHELVALAASIPSALKVRDGGKGILKQAARRILPAEVIDRPKGYFPVPALKILRGPYLDFARDVLESPAARRRGLWRPAAVRRLLQDPEGEMTPLGGSKLWQIALLEYWLQTMEG